MLGGGTSPSPECGVNGNNVNQKLSEQGRSSRWRLSLGKGATAALHPSSRPDFSISRRFFSSFNRDPEQFFYGIIRVSLLFSW